MGGEQEHSTNTHLRWIIIIVAVVVDYYDDDYIKERERKKEKHFAVFIISLLFSLCPQFFLLLVLCVPN